MNGNKNNTRHTIFVIEVFLLTITEGHLNIEEGSV